MRFAHSAALTCSFTDFCFLMRVTLMACSGYLSPMPHSLTLTTRLRAYPCKSRTSAPSFTDERRPAHGHLDSGKRPVRGGGHLGGWRIVGAAISPAQEDKVCCGREGRVLARPRRPGCVSSGQDGRCVRASG